MIPSPVAVGGVGGSGTRVVAAILGEVGYRLGGELNGSLDNLWFTLLFKRQALAGQVGDEEFSLCREAFLAAMTGEGAREVACSPRLPPLLREIACDERPQHTREWLEHRVNSLVAALRSGVRHGGPWAWKEPNTHVVFARLCREVPALRYVHVVRNGLDMAWSENQNQLAFWGELVLPAQLREGAPHRASLAYWCAAQRRVLAEAREFPGRFHLLSFDRLCTAPGREIPALLSFLGVDLSERHAARLAALVRRPASIGRHRAHGLDGFDPADVAYVRELGLS